MSTFQIPDGTKVRMSKKELIFGDTIVMARESNDILADTEALRQRIEEDGYLIIRNFHKRDDVMKGRKDIVDYMESQGVLAPGSTLENAIIGPQNRSTRFRDNVVKTWSDFLNIVEGKNTMDFFGRFLGDPALSLDHKWVRAVSTGRNASMHCDIVYMGAGTNNLYTMWTAFGDISLDMGPLALCLGSHKIQKLRNTYGASDAHDDLIQGAFSNDPYDVMETLGIQWASTPFNAGDVVIFGMYFMHASLENATNRFRISSDTRYQLASEAVDQRHMGKDPDEIPKADLEVRKSIGEFRKEWGLEKK
jgi:hypothetical protein